MKICGRKFCFYLVAVLLIGNFSCTKSYVKENNIFNVVKEKPTEKTIKVTDLPSKTRKSWQVGTFRGLIMGKATINDLQKVLGEPSEITDLESVGNPNEWAYHYEIQGDIKGNLVAYASKRTKTVISVEIRPDSMSRKEVLDYFGNDYVITRYNSDDCPGETFDSAPYYEDPNGESKFIEYRDKGVVIAIFEDDDTVQFISYLSGPMGSESSKCKRK
jgi:hypothetical protein